MVVSLEEFVRYLDNASSSVFIYNTENQPEETENVFDSVTVNYNNIIVQPGIKRIVFAKEGNKEYLTINRVNEVEILNDLVSYTTFIISSQGLCGEERKCTILSA